MFGCTFSNTESALRFTLRYVVFDRRPKNGVAPLFRIICANLNMKMNVRWTNFLLLLLLATSIVGDEVKEEEIEAAEEPQALPEDPHAYYDDDYGKRIILSDLNK